MDNAVALAALALTGTLAAGFFKLLNKLSKSIDENTKSNKQIASKTEMVAKATTTGNKEAKQRNGHLAELVIQQGESIKAVADLATEKIIEAVQHVEKQSVEHQIIKEVKHVPDRDKASK